MNFADDMTFIDLIRLVADRQTCVSMTWEDFKGDGYGALDYVLMRADDLGGSRIEALKKLRSLICLHTDFLRYAVNELSITTVADYLQEIHDAVTDDAYTADSSSTRSPSHSTQRNTASVSLRSTPRLDAIRGAANDRVAASNGR